MLAKRHIVLAALLNSNGSATSEPSEPPLLEFFQEGLGQPLLRREEVSAPRHRDHRKPLKAAKGSSKQKSVAPEEASLLHMHVGKHGIAGPHDCQTDSDCVDDLCGEADQVQCVSGWCFATREFSNCEDKPDNYILEDGGICTDSKREALCPPRDCRDLPIPKAAREHSFSVSLSDEMADFESCDDILQWEGIDCRLKPLEVMFCRKTCAKCNSFAPWDSQPPPVFGEENRVESEMAPEEVGGTEVETVKEFEEEQDRIEKETGEVIIGQSTREAAHEDDESMLFWVRIGLIFLALLLIFLLIAVYLVVQHRKKREERLLAELDRQMHADEGKDDSQPQMGTSTALPQQET